MTRSLTVAARIEALAGRTELLRWIIAWFPAAFTAARR
jgi:hypothetical protein